MRRARSTHNCQIKIPQNNPKRVKIKIIDSISHTGQESEKEVVRWRVTYGPFWYPYIGHYDSEKYEKAMEKYKKGILKSRPNGRVWHKVRYNRHNGEARSDLEILMAKYNFTFRDVREEVLERRREFLIEKYG
jgi:hypothetical protein